MEEVDEHVLDKSESLIIIEMFSLEKEHRFESSLECAFLEVLKVTNSEFEHIKKLLLINSTEDQVMRSLLLVHTEAEKSGVVLNALVLNLLDVIEGIDLVGLGKND